MFKTKKQLKEKIKQLICDIELLEISKDIAVNQLKIADGEIRNAKAVANYWKDKFKNSPTAINKHNEFLINHITSDNSRLNEEIKNLKEALKKEKGWSSIVDIHNDELNKENEKLKTQIKINNNYIKRLEKEVLIQKQTIKDKDECISILYDNSTLYTTMKTKLQNSQLKDKLDCISAIVNED